MKIQRLTAITLLGISLFAITEYVKADSPQEERRERAAEHIEQAFERDRVLGRFDLDADSEGGRTGYIELEGRVKNQSQRTRALSVARRVAPGYRLVNRIEIERPGLMGKHRR